MQLLRGAEKFLMETGSRLLLGEDPLKPGQTWYDVKGGITSERGGQRDKKTQKRLREAGIVYNCGGIDEMPYIHIRATDLNEARAKLMEHIVEINRGYRIEINLGELTVDLCAALQSRRS